MPKIGNLLVASPSVADWWDKSTVAILEQNQYGNTGVMINRKSGLSVTQLGEQLGFAIDLPGMVYIGGPTSNTTLVLLHSNEWSCSNTKNINAHFSMSTAKDIIQRLATGDVPCHWRVCIGLCAWSTSKLKSELDNNLWYLAESFGNLLFDHDEDAQWDMAICQSANYFSKSILPEHNN